MKKLLLLGAIGAALFGAPTASAAEGDVTINVTVDNGICSRDNSSWSPWTLWYYRYWKSTQENAPVVSFQQITRTDDISALYQNINDSSDNALGVQGKNYEIVYTLSILSDDTEYYISNFSFNAVPASAGATINGTAIATEGTVVSENYTVGDEIQMTVSATADNLIRLHDFTVTVSPKITFEEATGALEEYKSNLITSLFVPSTLFTAEEGKAALSGITIAEDAANFTEELNAAKAKVDAFNILPLVKEKINGKVVTLRNQATGGNGNYDYMSGVESGTIKHYANPDINCAWTIDFVDDSHVTLHNEYNSNYINATGASETAMQYEFAACADKNGGFTFRNTAVSGNNYLHQGGGNNIVYWNGDNGSLGSFWVLSLVSAEQEQEWKSGVVVDVFKCDEGTLGGQIIVSDSDKEAFYAGKQKCDDFLAADGLDYAAAKEISAMTAPSFTLNDVLYGQLFRIRSKGNKYYILNDNKPTFGNNGTVFYYSSERHLISMANGLAATNSGGMLTAVTTAEQNGKIAENAREITFIKGQGTETSRYEMTFMNGNEKRWVYNNGSNDVNGGRNITTSTAGYEYYTFALEPVMKLSVAVDGADGCGSIVAPVALIVPAGDDITVYEAKTTDNDKLKFDIVSAGTTVLAGTPLIVYSEGRNVNSVDFDVDYSALNAPATLAEEGAATVENRFGGSHLALVHKEAAETHVTYVKSAADVDAEGFEGTPVRFERLTEGDTVPAGAVTVKLVQDLKDPTQTPEYTLLSLDGENVGTTMIEEVTEGVCGAAEGAVYDLQGRRLAAPVKGINIINGKKVLVK